MHPFSLDAIPAAGRTKSRMRGRFSAAAWPIREVRLRRLPSLRAVRPTPFVAAWSLVYGAARPRPMSDPLALRIALAVDPERGGSHGAALVSTPPEPEMSARVPTGAPAALRTSPPALAVGGDRFRGSKPLARLGCAVAGSIGRIPRRHRDADHPSPREPSQRAVHHAVPGRLDAPTPVIRSRIAHQSDFADAPSRNSSDRRR